MVINMVIYNIILEFFNFCRISNNELNRLLKAISFYIQIKKLCIFVLQLYFVKQTETILYIIFRENINEILDYREKQYSIYIQYCSL